MFPILASTQSLLQIPVSNEIARPTPTVSQLIESCPEKRRAECNLVESDEELHKKLKLRCATIDETENLANRQPPKLNRKTNHIAQKLEEVSNCNEMALPTFAEKVEVAGDGHCYFHCLSLALEKPTQEIVVELTKYLRNNKKAYKGIFEASKRDGDHRTYAEYLHEVEYECGWANNTYILATQRVYNIDVYIIYKRPNQKPQLLHHSNSIVPLPNQNETENRKAVFLQNDQNIHFSFIKVNQNDVPHLLRYYNHNSD